MIPEGELVILDTSAVLELIRYKEVGQRIEKACDLSRRPERPVISIVTVGEALALARVWSWGPDKMDRLRSYLRELVVVDLRQGEITDQYAAITAHCRTSGISMGDNDRWIAATVAALQGYLVTTDKDFDPLDRQFINRVWFDPAKPVP